MEIREGEKERHEEEREKRWGWEDWRRTSPKNHSSSLIQSKFFDKNQLNIIRMAMIIKVDLQLVIKDAHSLLNEFLGKEREEKKVEIEEKEKK